MGKNREPRLTTCGSPIGLSSYKPLDNKSCQWSNLAMLDLEVIDDPATAVVALDPVRARLLAELVEPGSAASLAPRIGLARQKVNYHLRALEAHGLVRPVEERRWGGLVERRLVATAASFVVSPAALGEAANDPDRASDRLSARYLIALAARVVREVAELVRRSKEQAKQDRKSTRLNSSHYQPSRMPSSA